MAIPKSERLIRGRPAGLTDFDIRFCRLHDELRDLAHAACREKRIEAGALLAAEKLFVTEVARARAKARLES